MYHHTQNENGTYNTLCLYCFRTVASALESDNDLDKVEGQHICPERMLSELMARSKGECPCMHPNQN